MSRNNISLVILLFCSEKCFTQDVVISNGMPGIAMSRSMNSDKLKNYEYILFINKKFQTSISAGAVDAKSVDVIGKVKLKYWTRTACEYLFSFDEHVAVGPSGNVYIYRNGQLDIAIDQKKKLAKEKYGLGPMENYLGKVDNAVYYWDITLKRLGYFDIKNRNNIKYLELPGDLIKPLGVSRGEAGRSVMIYSQSKPQNINYPYPAVTKWFQVYI